MATVLEYAEETFRQIRGRTLEEARELCNKKGLNHRAIEIDGIALPGTSDIQPFRLNFKVENNVVFEISLG
jgi:hypothetical protein